MLTPLLVAAAATLSACQGGLPGAVASNEVTAISEGQSTIQVRWPGISGLAQRRVRSHGYQNKVETAVWGDSNSFPSGEAILHAANPTGRRFLVKQPTNSVESTVRRRYTNRSINFGPLKQRRHHVGYVEYQTYNVGNSRHCIGLRAYDGALPDEGFIGQSSINDSLGKSVLYGLYCVKNKSSLTAQVVEEVVDGIGIKGVAPIL